MSTSKRRKLNVEEPAQTMSAFALRKKLLAPKAAAPVPAGHEIEAGAASSSATAEQETTLSSNNPKGTKKGRGSRNALVQPTQSVETETESPPEAVVEDTTEISGALPSETDTARRGWSPLSLSDEDERHGKQVSSQPITLSSFQPSKKNFRRTKTGISELKLEDGDRLVVLGSYGIRVKSGQMTIYGATLSASPELSWVHAPSCYALPVIRCAEDAIIELHVHPDAHSLKALGRLSPLFRRLWPETSRSSDARGARSSSEDTFQILYTSEDGPKKIALQDLRSPAEWNKELATLLSTKKSKPLSAMITGPKSSGKSTFGKILTNRLLTSPSISPQRHSGVDGVAILDLDPGQPEYCVAGQIALVLVTKPIFSPSFCRPETIPETRVVRSHSLANVSPASNPDLYLEMAVDLMTYYRNTLATYPLVINTPGWIQGTGLDLLVSFIELLRPAEVIYMSKTGPAEVVTSLEEACSIARFTTLPSQAGQSSIRSAAHLRSMQMMSYFHDRSKHPQAGAESGSAWSPVPISSSAPWQVNYLGPNPGVLGIMCYDSHLQSGYVADAISGTILAAVEVESGKAFRNVLNGTLDGDSPSTGEADRSSGMDIDGMQSTQTNLHPLHLVRERLVTHTPEGLPFIDTSHGLTLDPRFSRSIGLVLLRAIDTRTGCLHLSMPITMEQFKDVEERGGQIVLVGGKFDSPTWAYTEYLYNRSAGDEEDESDSIKRNDTSADDSENGNETFNGTQDSVPYIEVHSAHQKRGAGSKAWRVRRDLGRLGNSIT
ncbi:hypothetical protein GGR57DRAFT_408259 [Xylariaceae sp. FL1272]|nr:hypothetical protein GGR57DRAFT_408259 [Xylariaceae sp. FL1272]